MSVMGLDNEEFDLPLCNNFEEKVLNDQLCFQVDLNKYKKVDTLEHDMKLGLAFFMDFNEDRQVILQENVIRNPKSLVGSIDKSHDNDNAIIYLDTLGQV